MHIPAVAAAAPTGCSPAPRPLRVGIISTRDLKNPWSSTHYYMHQALKRAGIAASHVAATTVKLQTRNASRRFFFRRHVARRRLTPDRDHLASTIDGHLRDVSYDAVLGLHASTLIPRLNVKSPLIYVTDATAALLHGYYANRTNRPDTEVKWLEDCEKRTIQRADAIVVPTQWAAESVIRSYRCPPGRLHVVEWGANLPSPPTPRTRAAPGRRLRLLLIGNDYVRKGGPVAIATVHRLRARGHRAELILVGCQVPRRERCDFVHAPGGLDRARPDQNSRFDQIMHESDVLIHPARAECYGHALCEAQAFGIPVVTTRTGGITQCVEHGVTGLLLPANSTPDDFADAIDDLVQNRSRYTTISQQAQHAFSRRLNWDCWATRTHAVIDHLIGQDDVRNAGFAN